MHVDLDARVLTSDGHDVGRVKHAVIDPADKKVAAFVISTGAILGRDVLISRLEIESARPDGDAIRLELSKAQFGNLPTFVRGEYSAPPAAYTPASADIYPDSSYLWPIAASDPASSAGFPTPGPLPISEPRGEPPGVDRGSKVVDRNGDEVGVVEDILFDEDSGKLRALVVVLGGPLQRLLGAGRTAKISASLVARFGDDTVHLRTVREQIDANT